jgi:hypothetical protein
MTPKEKAFVLYFKFYRDIIADNDRAKQCALIAVDEMLNELDDIMNFTGNKYSSEMIKYYREVKQEICDL